MDGSRIWIDLTTLCTGARKQSCIYLDYEKLRTVQDVEHHIRRVFGINNPICIFNEGWLLPSSESSRLLRDNDIVSIHEAETKCCPDSDQNNVNSKVPNNAVDTTNKILTASITEGTSTNRNTKESSLSNITVSIQNRENPISDPIKNVADPIRKVIVKEPAANYGTPPHSLSSPSTIQDRDSNTNISGNESNVDGEHKRKRIRRRKRKKKDETDTDATKPKEARQSPFVMNKLFQGVSHILNTSVADVNRKHVFFKEEPVDSSLKPNGEVSSELAVQGMDMNTATSVNTEGALSKLMSLGSQRSPVVFERKKPENKETNGIKRMEQGKPCSNIKLSPLTDIPVEGTVIMFKILKMVNYSPTISENITAQVISLDHEREKLYVRITEGLDELKPEKGKFCLDDEEEEDETQHEYMFLDWRTLLEPNAIVVC